MKSERVLRAERGAALLDRVRPGWAEEINTDELQMSNGCNCILGQLWSHYGYGRWHLDKAGANNPVAYGFNSDAWDGYETECGYLTRIWRRLVRTRLT